MSPRIPEINGAAIVLLGSFNPSIFQPQWFARQNLLSHTEADTAEVKLIHPQICHFETERAIVMVTADRFVATSKANADPFPLRDLVLGTFFILEHTPLTAMGLNRLMHFQMESEEAWHRLGDKLAPKAGWNGVLGVLEGRPGMQSLEILTRKKSPPGSSILVKVQPSVRLQFGVYFETNEHYPAAEKEPLKNLLDILRDRWEGAQAYAATVAEHILDWAK